MLMAFQKHRSFSLRRRRWRRERYELDTAYMMPRVRLKCWLRVRVRRLVGDTGSRRL